MTSHSSSGWSAAKTCRSIVAGSVTVRVRADAVTGKAILEVEDTGPGIPPSERPHVFERFYRVNSTRDSTFPGLGIGLYIAHEIIQRHGGRIWAESVEGNGSAFFVELPLLRG